MRACPLLMTNMLLVRVESHEDLIHRMGDNDDFVCALLLPLAGSTTDELTEEENDQLLSLQYLPSDKQREPDGDIQQILLETLLLVCDRQKGSNMTTMDCSAFSSVQRNRFGNTFARNRSI